MSGQAPKIRKKTEVLRLTPATKDKVERVYEPYEMNDFIYLGILDEIKKRGLKDKKAIEFFVNHLIKGKPRLYLVFCEYKKVYETKIRVQQEQKLLKKLNEIANDMEEAKNFGLIVQKESNKRKKGDKSEKSKGFAKEQHYYDFLDTKIEEIEVLIYLCVSPKRICLEFAHKYRELKGLNPIIYERWAEQTEHVDRIVFAFKKSADEHMFASQEFLLEWLDRTKHPELNMQHGGIVREVALFRSRMAGFLNRKKFGNKVEVIDDRPQRRIMDGKDIKSWLEGLDNIAGRVNGNIEEEEGEREDEFEEDSEEDSEEDNGNIQDAEIVED